MTATVKVTSTWPSTPWDLQSRLKLHTDADFVVDLDEILLEASECVQLTPPPDSSSEKCCLTFCSEELEVSRVVLVSQCRRVEAYATSGEYLFTREGRIIHDSEPDMLMFLLDLGDLGQSNFQLKLTGLQDSCWILALNAVVQPIQKKSPSLSHFDMANVNKLLVSSKAEAGSLSAPARNFKSLFETFSRAQGTGATTELLAAPASSSMALASLMALAGSASASPSSSSNLDSLKLVANLVKSAAPATTDFPEKKQQPASGEGCSGTSRPACGCQELLIQLEQRLEKQLRVQEEKLDQILSLLLQDNYSNDDEESNSN